MGSHYYVNDPNSELGYTPVPEDEYMQTVFGIANKHGIKITDEMILAELEKQSTKSRKKISSKASLTKALKIDNIILLKSPALAC